MLSVHILLLVAGVELKPCTSVVNLSCFSLANVNRGIFARKTLGPFLWITMNVIFIILNHAHKCIFIDNNYGKLQIFFLTQRIFNKIMANYLEKSKNCNRASF